MTPFKLTIDSKMKKILFPCLCLLLLFGAVSCKDQESYSDLLKDEEKATNAYLATQRVEMAIPEDEKFETGKDAPFYRMDDDGYVYMQVINAGDPDSRPEINDVVYFRFTRWNLKTWYASGVMSSEGNSSNMNNGLGATQFVYGNTSLSQSALYGSGIQIPMKYLGYDSEVNLVLRSYYGFSTDASACIPYLINIRYFKAEY